LKAPQSFCAEKPGGCAGIIGLLAAKTDAPEALFLAEVCCADHG
jgi:hypothetical protein